MASERSYSRVIVMFAALLSAGTAASGQLPWGGGIGALKDQLKERAFEKSATLLLNNDLPIVLDATTALPTVDTLPGGAFRPRTLTVSEEMMSKPLPSGDYVVNMTAFCTEYSVHRPGKGVAYKLAPLKGHAAQAVSTLLWRGMKAHVPVQRLMALTWAIQGGLSISEMPATFKADLDRLIPDYESDLSGDFMQELEDSYKNASRGTKMPPLDVLLEKMGPVGKAALAAKRQREALLAVGVSDEVKEQTLFAGQESGVYTPVSAEEGAWTERIPGVAYMRYKIEGGNLANNNIMEIRIVGNGSATAKAEPPKDGSAHLVSASYSAGQGFGSSLTSPTLISLLGAQENSSGGLTADGLIGYSQGEGAQALMPVPAPGKSQILRDNNPIVEANQTVVIGQRIALTISPSAAASGATVQNVKWFIPGKTIGDYTPTPQSYKTASVVPSDFSETAANFYWLDPEDARLVKADYTLSDGTTGEAQATINVVGPIGAAAVVNMGRVKVGTLAFTGTPNKGDVFQGFRDGLFLGGISPEAYFLPQFIPGIDFKEIGVEFTGSATNPSGFNGKLSWVQLITLNQTVKGPHSGMQGTGLLDNLYPYRSVSKSSGEYANDTPAMFLANGNTLQTATESFEMYLMWTPAISGDVKAAIPVPLGRVDWRWSGSAVYEASTKSWSASDTPVKTESGFSPFATNVFDAPDYGYPLWTSVLTNSLPKTPDQKTTTSPHSHQP